MSDNDNDMCGSLIGERYRILRTLGEGGMGSVYLAEDNDLGRQVAIKVLRDSLVDSPALARRLEMECQLLAHLGSHPNIVTLLDRQTIDKKTILVMEYVPGEDLSDIMERTYKRAPYQKGSAKPDEKVLLLTPRNAVLIAMQGLKALEYAHSRGVLHRDIKPSNIMVHRDDAGNITAKLMDFGIAKTLKQSSVDTAFTRLTKTEDRAPGTPAYMAPEQIEPERFGEIGPGTDLYAFGVMFFEMLTGRLPFVGGYTELMHAHTNVRPPSPREVNPLIKAELAHVIIRAMQKSPANRFKDATEMLETLQKAVGLSPADASHTTIAAKMDIDAPKERKPSTLPLRRIFLLLLLVGALGTAYWQGWTTDWFVREAPSVTTSGTDTAAEALSREQARSNALGMRAAADTPRVHEYALGEWERAERLFEQADNTEDAGEAARWYAEAGQQFTRAHNNAIDRENRALERVARESETVEFVRPDARGRTEAVTQTIDLGGGVEMEFVWIQPGSFQMGSRGQAARGRGSSSSVPNDETPSRTVRITEGFWIGKYEVTQAQWVRVMGYNPARFSSDLQHPVEQISWSDCQRFLAALNERGEEGEFRLPTEAEWEYACRSGAGSVYSFGNDLARLSEHAWYAANSNATTHPVGSLKPNAWGLYDMHGNVAEWVQDWYDPEIYKTGPTTNPHGPNTGVFRVRRGGAWSNHFSRLRSAVRDHDLPDLRSDMYGLRVVLSE